MAGKDLCVSTTADMERLHGISVQPVSSLPNLVLTARVVSLADPNATTKRDAFSMDWIHDCKATGCLFNLSEDETVRSN